MSEAASQLTRWMAVSVTASPFPRAPYTDTQFELLCEEVHGFWMAAETPDFGSSCGVLEFTFHNDYPPDKRAREVSEFLLKCGLEAADIRGQVVWTVMRSD